ncbi:TetR/AcrR family transcriptional regulator [Jatrophihabitans fulvus]
MVRNDGRRQEICDAGLDVLAEEGARGLTHRALDRRAGVPAGTTGNYFPTRAALVLGLAERIEQRLQPDAGQVAAMTRRRPSHRLLVDYMQFLLRRLLDDRAVTTALFELRLEAARRPELAEVMGGWLRSNFAADVDFHVAAGLPGTPADLLLVRFAIEGLAFDQLTLPVDASLDLRRTVTRLVQRLVPRST